MLYLNDRWSCLTLAIFALRFNHLVPKNLIKKSKFSLVNITVTIVAFGRMYSWK